MTPIPSAKTAPMTVDARAFRLFGQPVLLLMGELHYSRSPRELWPRLLDESRAAGLNGISSYVFWNQHEPSRDIYDFSGGKDLAHFLQLCAERDLNVFLRSGPYCCAEWNYGGYPAYLRDEPGITIRTSNAAYQDRVEKYFEQLVPQFRPYLATNGGPVCLVQVENEYANVARRYGSEGQDYLTWIDALARRLGVDVPVIMCEGGAENSIETVNGFSISATRRQAFRQAHPELPMFWTEFWTAWYDTWGFQRHRRDSRNIGYHLLDFLGAGGSGWNYYMWHGGTNFGRTSMYLGTTSYDFDAPLDEFGRPTLKSRYLQRLHAILEHHSALFLEGTRTETELSADRKKVVWQHAGRSLELHLDAGSRQARLMTESGEKLFDTEIDFAEVSQAFVQPPWTDLIVSLDWQTWPEPRPADRSDLPLESRHPIEQLTLTRDESDYCWYGAELDRESDGEILLEFPHAADVLMIFIDGELRAKTRPPFLENRGPTETAPAEGGESIHVNPLEGSKGQYRQSFSLKVAAGRHRLEILVASLGLIKGDWMVSGPMNTERKGIWNGARCNGAEITGWAMHPGLVGERLGIASQSEKVAWEKPAEPRPVGWFRTTFELSPETLALDADFRIDAQGLGKGMLFLNGHALGRHWLIEAQGYGADVGWHDLELDGLFLESTGQPSQRYYHMPRAWLQRENQFIIFEEESARPEQVALQMRVAH